MITRTQNLAGRPGPRRTGRLWAAATCAAVCASLLVVGGSATAGLPQAAPADVGLDPQRLAAIDTLVAEGLADKKMPGCVICVGRHGKIAWLKAYGLKRVEPHAEPMTVDTVFDMASITKPVATATSVMLLVERGRLNLSDKVSAWIPEFAANEKRDITVRDLLLHQSGLLADNPLADYADGPEQALQRINELKLLNPIGAKFVYSDVNFIVLGDLVRRASGMNVHEFSQREVFGPLGLRATGYLPGPELQARAAPTEQRDGAWIQGTVHDPRAYKLGGVAGHAGLFSTAEDMAVYAQLLLNRGEYAGRRILTPQTVAVMTRGERVASGCRGLGWDKRTGFSSNRGDLFSDAAFGHGGFTGTVLWIDPELDLFYLFLSNRVHPNGKGLVNPLAGRIATVIGSAVLERQVDLERPAASGDVRTGLDVLQQENFRRLAGRKVGLITNHTGRNRDGVSAVELLRRAPGMELVALFSPEHGFAGQLDVAKIGDTRDPASGLPVFSLYGETRRPTAEMLAGVDTLVFDIQDIGTRFYTYVSTMGEALRACAEHGRRFVVLDRPNPLNGVDVAGPLLDKGRESFVGYHTLPVRHGMTVGELARMFQTEFQLKVELEVVPCEGWRRAAFWDETGLTWVNPSPNMRSLTEALLYPGVGLLETTNLSVGRGTNTPFEVIGAPWLDGRRLAAELNARRIPGVAFVPVEFTPDASKFAKERCGGVNIVITDRRRFEPLRTGFEIAVQLRRLYPEAWEAQGYARLLGQQRTHQALLDGAGIEELQAAAREGLADFLRRRSAFLLYD